MVSHEDLQGYQGWQLIPPLPGQTYKRAETPWPWGLGGPPRVPSCLGQLPLWCPEVCASCRGSARLKMVSTHGSRPRTWARPVLRDLDAPQRGPLEAGFLMAASFRLRLTSARDRPVDNSSHTLSAATAARSAPCLQEQVWHQHAPAWRRLLGCLT